MNNIGPWIIVIAAITLIGIIANQDARNNSGTRHLKCYSAGTLIYEGDSNGPIGGSDNIQEFHELNTNRHVYIEGDCVITRNQ